MRHLLLIFFCLFSSPLFAYENIDLELSSGISMNMNQFHGQGKTLFLWLPSERGMGKGYVPVALNLSVLDFDVWAVNLHETYFISPGRQSLNNIDLNDLLEIIKIAQLKGFESIFILSSGRGMQLALKMTHLWQQKYSASPINGLISFSPYLLKGRTEMGQDAEYLDYVAYSNLPIYLIQAQFSTKYARSREITEHLQQGGSPVYVHSLKGVHAGYHMRSTDDLSEADKAAKAELASILEQASYLLAATKPAIYNRNTNFTFNKQNKPVPSFKEAVLHPYKGNPVPPPLELKDLSGNSYNLQQSKGDVVLVNFWATWCKPCVREIPSLSRLVSKMDNKSFKVVAVNIGESSDTIRKFNQLFDKTDPVNFDILLDEDGGTVRDWKVYAYPSNFLIGQNGKIQYAYRGALEWDSEQIVQTINSLVVE